MRGIIDTNSAWVRFGLGALLIAGTATTISCGNDDDDDGSIGEATQATMSISPSVISFSSTDINETATVGVTISNTGDDDLVIRSMRIRESQDDDVQEFFEGENFSKSLTIASGEEFVFGIDYVPKNTVRDSGALIIESNDSTAIAEREGITEVEITSPELQPELFTDSEIQFLRVPKGESEFVVATVQNTGAAPLEINDMFLVGANSFEVSYPTLDADGAPNADPADDSENYPTVVEPNGSFPVRVTFSPEDENPATAELHIFSNDPNEDDYVVNISGNSGSPCISLNFPEDEGVQYGESQIGRATKKTVAIENCAFGTPLKVNEINLTDDGGGVFQIEQDSLPDLPAEIAPREQATFVLGYTPTGENVDMGELEILNDDPAKERLRVPIQGRGTNNACPTASAKVKLAGNSIGQTDLETIPLKTVEFTPEGSTDTDGSVERYRWNVVNRPSGSTSRLLPNDSSEKPTLFLDVAGTYEVELTVYDADGLASCETATVTIKAIPDEDIHVQLVWSTPGDSNEENDEGADVDLHYLHPRGKWNATPYDIFWQNIEADWGPPGATGDPSLDIDDTDGAGPENVNHDDPETGLAYAVGVYYYADHGFGASYATIRIFIEGQLKFEAPDKYLAREGVFWYVGAVRWPSKEIVQRNQITPGFPN